MQGCKWKFLYIYGHLEPSDKKFKSKSSWKFLSESTSRSYLLNSNNICKTVWGVFFTYPALCYQIIPKSLFDIF